MVLTHQKSTRHQKNKTPEMKAPTAILLVFAAFFVQKAVGIQCDSFCAACWKIGSQTGEDTKISCTDHDNELKNCGDTCPGGYQSIHCAKPERCHCESNTQCNEFGPCAYGVYSMASSGDTYCETPWGDP